MGRGENVRLVHAVPAAAGPAPIRAMARGWSSPDWNEGVVECGKPHKNHADNEPPRHKVVGSQVVRDLVKYLHEYYRPRGGLRLKPRRPGDVARSP